MPPKRPILRKGPSGPDAALTSTDVLNASDVPGVTVTDALDNLIAGGVVTTDAVVNTSAVPGASASDALDDLQSRLTTDGVTNQSTVPGATATDALDSLQSEVDFIASELATLGTDAVANQSGVPGATASDALDALNSIIGALTSSDVQNVSTAAGVTVTNALDSLVASLSALAAQIAALDSSDIANVSFVAGATVTNALQSLASTISSLDTNDIANASTVIGGSLTAALDTLAGLIAALDSSDIANASSVPGATVTNALDALSGAVLALDSSDIANVSTVPGATVTNALDALVSSPVIPLSSLAPQAANTIVANATAALASPTAWPVGVNTVVGRVAGDLVAAQLVTAQVAANQVTNALLAQMAANTIKANPTAALADAQDLTVATNTVVGRVGGNLVAAQIVTAQIALNQVTNPVLAQMAALTVKANAANAPNDPQDVSAAADDTVFRRTASALSFGQLTAGMFPSGVVPIAALAAIAANAIVANATAGAASPTAVSVGVNTVVGRVAGNIVAAQVVTAQIAVNQVTNAVLAQMAANTVKVNATAALADPQDVAIGTNTVLGRVAGNIVAAQVVGAQIATNTVANGNLAQMAALTVKANATGALANAADLAAGADDTVLRRTAGALSFGQLTAGMFPAAIVPLSSLATQAANTVVANATAGVASPTAVTVGTNTVLGRVAGNIVAAQVVGAQIATNTVVNTNLAQMAALSVKANPTSAAANAQDSAPTLASRYLRSTSTLSGLEWGALPLEAAFAAGTWFGNNAGNSAAPIANDWTSTVGPNLRYATGAANGAASTLDLPPSTSAQSTTSAAPTFSLPSVDVNGSALAVGDRMVAVFECQNSTTTVTPPAGWTQIADLSAFFNVCRVYVHDWLASEPASITFTLSASRACSVRFFAIRGANPAVATAVSAITGSGFAATTVDPASFSPSFASSSVNTLFLSLAALTNTISPPVISVFPTSTVKQQSDTLAAGLTLGSCQRNLSAATWDPSAWTFTSADTQQSITLAFQPSDTGLLDMAAMAANTIKGNPTAGSADPQNIAIGANTVLGRVAGNIVAAQIVGAQIATNTVANGNLAQMAALTVKANATGALANAADLAAGADDTVLRRTAGALSFGQLTAGMFPAAIVPLSSLATQAANTVVANATAGVASPTAVAIGTNTVLGRVAGNIVAAQVVTAQIAVNQVTNAVLAQMAANTVKVNATAALADPQDVTIGTNTVLGRVAGNIVAAQVVGAQIAASTVANGNLAQMIALSVKANATAGTANPTDISAAGVADSVLIRSGVTLVFDLISNANVASASLNLNRLATIAANTVVANATAGAASPTAVAVGTNTVLGRVAGNIVAAQLVGAQVASATLPLTTLATVAANTVVANATAGAASPTAVAIGANTVLGRVAGDIVAAQVVTSQIAVNNVTNAVLAQMANGFFKARFSAGTGNAEDVSPNQAGSLLRFGPSQSTSLAAGTTTHDLAVSSGVVNLFITVTGSGDATLTGLVLAGGGAAQSGARIRITKLGASSGRLIIPHATGSTANNQFITPNAANWVMTYPEEEALACRTEANSGDFWRLMTFLTQPAAITATELATAAVTPVKLSTDTANGEAPAWRKIVAFTASGAAGTLIDVFIWNANSPALRICFGQLRLSVAFAGTCALRTATGGGGAVVLPSSAVPTSTFDTTATGRRNDNSNATATLAAGSTLVLRIDRSCTGEVMLDLTNV